MLLQDLYNITSSKKESNAATALFTLNSKHAIFNGHFPGQPVLPGACQVQMVKEIMQTLLNAEIRLVKAGSVKFLSPIVPNEDRPLQMDIKYDLSNNRELTVVASIVDNGITCFKFNGVFNVVLHDGW